MTPAIKLHPSRAPATHLDAILERGEDSCRRFTRDISHVDGMAAELAAFADMRGGVLLKWPFQ